MSRSTKPALFLLAVLAAVLFGVAGCHLLFPQAVRPLGGPLVGSAGEGASLAPGKGILDIAIRWPQRDYPGYKVSAIPLSTRGVIVRVLSPSSVELAQAALVREPGTGDASTSIEVDAGANIGVEVKAYRDTPQVSGTATASILIAQGFATVNVNGGQRTKAKVTLEPLFVPAIASMSENVGVPGDEVVFYGNNLGPADGIDPRVTFAGIPAASISVESIAGKYQLRVKVPDGAAVGIVKVTNDGIPSTSQSVFWVPKACSLDADRKFWDRAAPTARTALAGLSGVQFIPSVTWVGSTESFVSAPPPKYWLSNGTAGSVDSSGLFKASATGLPAVTTVVANYGSVSSNGITVEAREPSFVGGVLSGSRTWSRASQPYIVNSNVGIAAGTTLVIEPGVFVLYSGAYQIHVKGAIRAVGSADLPVTFTPLGTNLGSGASPIPGASPTPTPDATSSFGGGGGTPDPGASPTPTPSSTPVTTLDAPQLLFQANLSDSILSRVVMLRGGRSIEFVQDGNSNTLLAEYISIEDSSIRTLAVDGKTGTGALRLVYANIKNASITSGYPRGAPVTIEDSTLSAAVVEAQSYSQGVAIASSSLSSANLYLGCCGASMSISNSIVYGGTFSNSDDGDLVVAGSRFLKLNLPLSSRTNATLSESVFDVSGSPSAEVVSFGSGAISGCEVRGNPAGIGVRLLGNYYSSVIIRNTKITGNKIGIKIDADAQNTYSRSIKIQNSILDNSTYNIENRSATPSVATGNYWGTIDGTEVARKIYDGRDDLLYGEVLFEPFLLSAPF